MRTRIPARPGPALAAFAAYLLVFYGVWMLRGIDYPHIGDDAHTLLNWYVLPLAAGAVVLVVATSVLGWWRPAVVEDRRLPRWTVVPGVLMAALAVAVLVGKDFSHTTGAMLLWCVVGSVGVGFCEEFVSRGLLVVGFRPVMSERRVWLATGVLFGLLHLPNWVFGAGHAAAVQVVTAALTGSTLYLLRRGSGGLLAAMVVHGFWDFSAFAGAGHSPLAAAEIVLALVSTGSAFWLTGRDDTSTDHTSTDLTGEDRTA